MTFEGKSIIGLTQEIEIFYNGGKKAVLAKIDTGATKSSIDQTLAKELNLGPFHAERTIKSAAGKHRRPALMIEIEICGKKIKEEFNIADRAHMKFPVLIGLNVLKHDFIIDPSR